jgi:polar amino acid transport system substrate-binding protein
MVGPIGPDDWIMLARADSKITLKPSTMRANTRSVPTRAMHCRDPGQAGLEANGGVARSGQRKKLVNGQIDLWATGDPAGRYLARQDG